MGLAAAPEIVLAAAGCVMVLLDAFAPSARRWFATLSLAAIGASTWYLVRAPIGLAFAERYETSDLTIAAGLFAAATAAVALLVAKPYLQRTGEEKGEFYALLLWGHLGVLLMIRGLDLLVVFIGLETLSLSFYVLAAFFRNAHSTPMTLQQAIDYVWLGQAFLTLLPWSVDPDTVRMVRSGDVAYERLRPLDTHTFWYVRALARRIATPLLRAIPMVLTAGVLFHALGMSRWALSAPASGQAAVLFLVSMVLVVALSAAIGTLMDIGMVAAMSERGINAVVGPIVLVFSGSLVPLPLYPDWLQPAMRVQPFAGLIDTPFRIYGGHIGALDALAALSRQAVWVVVFVLLGRWCMTRVMSRLQAQGG